MTSILLLKKKMRILVESAIQSAFKDGINYHHKTIVDDKQRSHLQDQVWRVYKYWIYYWTSNQRELDTYSNTIAITGKNNYYGNTDMKCDIQKVKNYEVKSHGKTYFYI